MNPAGTQGQNGTNGSNFGSTGSEPTTPAVGASNIGADPVASGIGVDDATTRGSGPDSGESSFSTGSMQSGGSSSMGGGSSMGGSSGTGGDMGDGAQGQRFGAVREQAMKLRGQATDRARSAAEDQKARATDALDNFSRAIHEAAGSLEEQVGPQIAQYAHRAADTLDEFSASLRNKSVDELVDDARGFVRRSPAVAIGTAVALGFALARFLKATADDDMGYRRNNYALDDDDDMPSLATTASGDSQPRYNA